MKAETILEPEPARMEIGDLAPFAIVLVVVGIIIAFGLQVEGEVKDDFGEDGCAANTDGFTTYNATAKKCQNSSGSQQEVGTVEFNATTKGQEGVENLANKLPTIGLIAAIVIVIGLLVAGLYALANRM